MPTEPILNTRQKILKALDESLSRITVDNGYNFDAGIVDEEKGINKVLKDFKPTSKLTGQFPCCYSRLGPGTNEQNGEGTTFKTVTKFKTTTECFIGIAVSSDKGEGALRDELEKAIQDLENFTAHGFGADKGHSLYTVSEVKKVLPEKPVPFYDNGATSGWAVMKLIITTQN